MKGFVLAIVTICCLGLLMTNEAQATHGQLFLQQRVRQPTVQRQIVVQRVRRPVVQRQPIFQRQRVVQHLQAVQQVVQPYAVQQVVAPVVQQQYVAPQAIVVPQVQQYVAPVVTPQAVQGGCQSTCPNVF